MDVGRHNWPVPGCWGGAKEIDSVFESRSVERGVAVPAYDRSRFPQSARNAEGRAPFEPIMILRAAKARASSWYMVDLS